MTLFAGVFLDDRSRVELISWWRNRVGVALLDLIYCDHVTISYAPSYEDVDRFAKLKGDPCTVRVIGIGIDEKAQAVLVETFPFKSMNKFPHVTVAARHGVDPVYSNDLLSREMKLVHGPELSGSFDLRDT